MHGVTMKISQKMLQSEETINTSQGYVQKYEDLKRKLYNCNANVYFNNLSCKNP